ncbi:hypothetical protein F2Q70_00028504 [Brassica cretica]|uniref:ABC transporter domain-containing protein n=1 Tax=Brassica cretica TaxID=69181 RepID=A0A8S9LI84_BRACR|nr:hypothetical protein F2Q70_00028504 [Brassica cretica]
MGDRVSGASPQEMNMRMRTFLVDTQPAKIDYCEIGKSMGSSFRSSSSRNENEDEAEHALQWAEIQRLPSFKQLRSSLVDEEGDDVEKGKRVVDVTKLGAMERHLMIEKLIKHIENDNLKLLKKIRRRIDRVGVELPSIEVRYKHLSVEAECEVVEGKALPTLWNSLKHIFLELVKLSGVRTHEAKISILNDISGIINPGRLTLLLGPPGCGKTTLLKALSGNLDKNLKLSGEISYNGHGLNEFVPRKTSAYISQHDLHTAEMTVRETIDFSARCQGVGSRTDIMMEVSKREKDGGIIPDPDVDAYMKAISVNGLKRSLQTDYILKILGLDICAETLVGNAMKRGISGGQKKRLTTGEMVVGPAKALFMDEITNGLDSSTAFQIVKSLQQLAHITNATVFVSLLQPAPESYDLFDDIVLMAEGKLVYHGPRDEVLRFFEECGFRCPERKGVADFLQEVISRKDQGQYWLHQDIPHSFVSVDALSKRFKELETGRKIEDALSKPYDKSKTHKDALSFSDYSLPKWELFRACISREFLLMKRNFFVYLFKTFQLVVSAILTMTVFIRTRMGVDIIHGNSYMSCLFFATVVLLVDGFPELSMTVQRLAVFYKQKQLCFYPAWAYAIPATVLKIPLSFFESLVWTCLANSLFSVSFINLIHSTGKMALPFKPLTITFQDLNYYVDVPAEMRVQGYNEKKLQLLSGITGAFRPGVLTALMGISGAGKTTLLDVLAGRKTSGYIEGEIRINGYLKVQETFARVSGYCEQTDIHSPNITVEESLIYSAWLRLVPEIDHKTKIRFVKEVLETIELEEIKDAMVGVPGQSGLSTEQRKRLTVAVELVANPSIIFMDEPTTGLDARAAAIVMRAVKNVAETGRTIVCTIHQPSIDIFEAFDELVLLKRGGRMIYTGPLGQHSSHVIQYFESIPGVAKIKDNYNPATWMLEVTSQSVEIELNMDFAKIYNESALYKSNYELAQELSKPDPGSSDLHFERTFAQSWWEQFKSCLWKMSLSYWRSPAYNLMRIFHTLVSSLIFGLLFWKQGQKIDTQQNLFTVLGAIYGLVIFLGVNNCTSALQYFETERNVMYRERFAGMYSAFAFALAQVVTEIPYIFIQSAEFVIIIYPMMGLYGSAYKVFWSLYSMFCNLLSFNYLALFLISITPNFMLAAILQSLFFVAFNLFAGFLIPLPQIPKWWVWLYYLIPPSWSLNVFFSSQYGDIHQEINAFGETTTVARFLEDYFGFHHDRLITSAIILIAFPVVLASMSAFFVAKLNFQKR